MALGHRLRGEEKGVSDSEVKRKASLSLIVFVPAGGVWPPAAA